MRCICCCGDKLQPLLLYEQKLVVDLQYNRVDHHHLMDVAIQGYYCLHQYQDYTVVQCLTSGIILRQLTDYTRENTSTYYLWYTATTIFWTLLAFPTWSVLQTLQPGLLKYWTLPVSSCVCVCVCVRVFLNSCPLRRVAGNMSIAH